MSSSVSGNMKGFYKQKKNPNPITAAKSSKSRKPPIHASTSPSLNSNPDLQDEHNGSEAEAVLRQFDMNMKYGPCMGMTRLARLERAVKLGLNPPQEIAELLKSGNVQQESLWDTRI